MERYDYKKEICNAIREYLNNNGYTIQDLKNDEENDYKLRDELWLDDCITGNASGSFTFSTWDAEECICHNLDILIDALEEYGYSESTWLRKGSEYCDVLIRCYLLDECIQEVIEEDGKND